jgi:hypothetical protein
MDIKNRRITLCGILALKRHDNSSCLGCLNIQAKSYYLGEQLKEYAQINQYKIPAYAFL